MNKLTFFMFITLCFIFIAYSSILHAEIKRLEKIVSKQQHVIVVIEEVEKEVRKEIEKEKIEENALSTFTARVTAYAPHDNKSGICADENPKVTSTGIEPRVGIVAVDPTKIPYGTKLNIPGYGMAEAQDTGGALRQYDGIALDVVMESYEEAIEWGVQYLEVYKVDSTTVESYSP